MTPPTAAPDQQTAYIDPPTAATLSKAENMTAEVPVARVPIGAQLKMLGGMFTVTNADRHRLTLRGPLGKLPRNKPIQIFGVTAQVTMIGKHVATLTARRGVFDYRPILRIMDDIPPAVVGQGPELPEGTTAQDLGANTEPPEPAPALRVCDCGGTAEVVQGWLNADVVQCSSCEARTDEFEMHTGNAEKAWNAKQLFTPTDEQP